MSRTGRRILGAMLGAGGLGVALCLGHAVFLVHASLRGPHPHVVRGEEMKPHHLETVRALGLLQPGEEIIYFHSEAFRDVADDLCFITSARLVMHGRDRVPASHSVPFSEIEEVWLDEETTTWGRSVLTVATRSGERHTVLLPSARGGDRNFAAEVGRRLR